MDAYHYFADAAELAEKAGIASKPLDAITIEQFDTKANCDELTSILMTQEPLLSQSPSLFLIDVNGESHHVSYSIASGINSPFTYVVVDAHVDDQLARSGTINFYSFISAILDQNRRIAECVIVGGDVDEEKQAIFQRKHLPVRCFPVLDQPRLTAASLQTEGVYLSIDFDYLWLRNASCSDIIIMIDDLAANHKHLVGVDMVNLREVNTQDLCSIYESLHNWVSADLVLTD